MNPAKRPRPRGYSIGLHPTEHSKRANASEERQALIADIIAVDAIMSDAPGLDELHAKQIKLPDKIMDFWLWKTDPCEGCSLECFLNLNHLIGLVIVRHMALEDNASEDRVRGGIMQDIPVSQYTLRNLVDAVQFLQYEWNSKGLVNNPGAKVFLSACMRRLGTLAMTGGPREIMDHEGSVDEVPAGDGMHPLRMSLSSIRRMLCVFLCIHRHIRVKEKSTPLPPVEGENRLTRALPHHIYGSEDMYIEMSYHHDLMVGAKMTYMHDFQAMYHTISQVIYYHNPDYKLPPRVVNVDAVNDGVDAQGCALNAANTFPAFLQMYPEVKILFEESAFDITAKPDGYSLLILGANVYLWTPEGGVHEAGNLVDFMKYYASKIPH